LMLMLMMMATD